jgi:hypothetical protein
MPQKKAKKAKSAKASKPAKPAKAAKGASLGAALKKAAKNVAKSVGLASAKKGVAAKKTAPAKGAAAKPIKAVSAVKGKKAAPALAPVKAKGKKEAPKQEILKPAAKGSGKPDAKGKKASEVVVVVPAPKGVAILTKDGKGKKGRAASEAAAAKLKRCREPGCDHEFTLLGYCRLHYIKNWRRIKRKEAILASGQLNNYVEELVNKYPDKYLDVIRQDLATEKEWSKVVVDLELEGTDDESGAEEDIDAAAEGVRAPAGGGGGRGEFDDEGDSF